jgi:class 3 adenylate cyclase/tetratricopeptide (TPR) repeat protein
MICPRCQTVNGDGARFCSNCGQALEAPAAPRPPEGERKVVTVLFADVVGSTAMGERLDPEQVTEVMNGAFGLMNRAIDHYGGTVARLMGDAVLAIFGAPAAHEDDPERAVRAGLEIQAAARDYAAQVQKTYGLEFNVRVGIHTGLAVLDQVGDRIRAEYTAVGDTPNVAARMQTAAAPGTVLVSADTHRLTQHVFDFEARGLLAVKGKAAPIETWQAAGVRAVPASPRGLEGLRAPLVGREAEIARLRQRLTALQPGQPGAWVTLAGEAGLGKSRLVAELRQTFAGGAEPAKMVWLEGRCISYGGAISYLPWRQVVRQSIDAQEAEPDAAVRSKLERSGLPREHLPFLETLLAVASAESLAAVQRYSGEELVRRLSDSVRDYLGCLARATPLVLVFEDLHWADEASLALLQGVSGLVALNPILIIGLMRPDQDTPAWALADNVRQTLPAERVDTLALEPLSTADSRHLLGLLLHIEDLPERVRQLILEKSEGNPFFVEEVIRSLLDSGHIVREQGYWRATRAIEQVAIPSTLAGLLAARMDALPDEAKRVAQMSAVIGRTFAFRVIKTICAAAPAAERILAVQPPLDLLARQEIVRVHARVPELEYAFKHALMQEAAYSSLLLRRRREFHGRAGQALEALYADRLEELAPILAHHFRLAEDWERAAAYSQRAGEAALRLYALREAMRQYDRAIEACDKAPGEHPAEVCDAILGWARAAFKFRPYPEQLERLKRAEQIARQLSDKHRLAFALHAIGTVHLASGRALRAVPVLNEAFQLAEELGDEALATLPSFHAAFIKMDSDPQASLGMYDHALELARKHGNPDLETYALSAKGWALGRLGRFDEARAALQSAFDIFRSAGSGSPVTESDLELFAGWTYLDMGDAPASLAHGQRSVQCSIAADNFDCLCGGLACIGFGQMQSGQLSAAAESFEDAIEHTKASGAAQFEVLARGGLALAHMAGGGPEGLAKTEALAELEQAAARAHDLHDSFTEALFNHQAAHAHLAQGDLAGARAYLDRALDYYQRNAMEPYLAQALATQAALNERRGAK